MKQLDKTMKYMMSMSARDFCEDEVMKCLVIILQTNFPMGTN